MHGERARINASAQNMTLWTITGSRFRVHLNYDESRGLVLALQVPGLVRSEIHLSRLFMLMLNRLRLRGEQHQRRLDWWRQNKLHEAAFSMLRMLHVASGRIMGQTFPRTGRSIQPPAAASWNMDKTRLFLFFPRYFCASPFIVELPDDTLSLLRVDSLNFRIIMWHNLTFDIVILEKKKKKLHF